MYLAKPLTHRINGWGVIDADGTVVLSRCYRERAVTAAAVMNIGNTTTGSRFQVRGTAIHDTHAAAGSHCFGECPDAETAERVVSCLNTL